MFILRHRYEQSPYRTVYLRGVVALDDLKMSEVLFIPVRSTVKEKMGVQSIPRCGKAMRTN